MEDSKDFQGKTLDEAIRSACTYFDAPREKLEIEIIEDAKSGLFGIVGVRKATIRARRVSLKESVDRLLEGGDVTAEPGHGPETAPAKKKSASRQRPAGTQAPAAAEKQAAPAAEIKPELAGQNSVSGEHNEKEQHSSDDARSQRPSRRRQPKGAEATGGETASRPPRQKPHKAEHHPHDAEEDGGEPDERHVPFEELDQDKMRALAEEAARHLVLPIIGEVPITVSVGDGYVDVNVDCGEQSGLLIGREGQTLAALQYLASRIVSARMGASVRVQVNAGDYRERQDGRLRELAFVLAERVRATGRACSTRPMSSYHRRIIHLALQDSPDVQTRSSGEGPMKRIIVQKKKNA